MDPLLRHQWHYTGPRDLQIERMALASSHLVGEIDAAAFANRRAGEPLPFESPTSHTRRLVRSIECYEEGEGLLRVDFHVQSALYKMVRNMMGLLLLVGDAPSPP